VRRVLGRGGAGFRLAWGTTDELGQQIPLLLMRECLGGARLVRADATGGTRGLGAAGYRAAVAGPLPSGDPVLAAGSAIWLDRGQLWLMLVNIVGAIAGQGWQALIVAVAGGGVMLYVGVLGMLRGRQRSRVVVAL
jgi:hypothetical protein